MQWLLFLQIKNVFDIFEEQSDGFSAGRRVDDVDKDIDNVDEPVPGVDDEGELWRLLLIERNPLNNVDGEDADHVAEDQHSSNNLHLLAITVAVAVAAGNLLQDHKIWDDSDEARHANTQRQGHSSSRKIPSIGCLHCTTDDVTLSKTCIISKFTNQPWQYKNMDKIYVNKARCTPPP